MKKLLNYIFYGFYQIDNILAQPGENFYHIRTASLLFSISIVSYIISFINLLSLFFFPFFAKCCNSIEDWAMKITTLGLVIALLLNIYWFRDKVYVDDFREFDKEPSFMKWVFFCVSLAFGIVGIIWALLSGFKVRSELAIFFL